MFWTGRIRHISWRARQPDLSSLDFLLWGYVKDKVYKLIPSNIEEIKQAIQEFFENVPVKMCKNAIYRF